MAKQSPPDERPRNHWRSHVPFGLLDANKPRHFRTMLRVIRQNITQLPDAWRVLNGPCNGCAVQTDGLRDNVLPDSPHFCLTRLGLIEEALRPPFDPTRFADVAALAHLRNEDLEALGRIPVPLLRRRGDSGFQPLTFDAAYDLAADWIRHHRGDRSAWFTTSKAINNEEYFAFQKFARVVGRTNNLDSCARQCHAASVSALKSTLGVGATSGSLADFMRADILVLAGTNLANNQPLIMRYIDHAKRTRDGLPFVIVVNPYLEPGLNRYWVPSSPISALMGTQICNQFIRVRVGGDVAFFNAVLKCLLEENLLKDHHRQFIANRTVGFDKMSAALRDQPLTTLAGQSGAEESQIREVARRLADAENITFAWGMGLTQHATGTNNVKSVVNLALALGQFGRPGAGIAPLRGQSSVQAAGECGVAPNIFPGGDPVNAQSAAHFAELWNADVPAAPGLATGPMLEAAHRGELDLLFCLGGNLLDTMPDRPFIRETLARIPFRIRLDVMMNSEALVEPGDALLVLPVRNWYEWQHVFTTTSTDRTIRAFGPSIRPRCPEVPESWQLLRTLADRVLDPTQSAFNYTDTDAIRREMDQSIWMYRGISRLNDPHAELQWGGEMLYTNGFDRMPDGRARFTTLTPRVPDLAADEFILSTRRGFGQWNSQHRTDTPRDYMSGATSHRDILINPDDALRLNLRAGQQVRLCTAASATATGIARPDPRIGPRHIQVFWPFANDLIPRGRYDPDSHEPDYNVAVRIQPL